MGMGMGMGIASSHHNVIVVMKYFAFDDLIVWNDRK